MPEVWPVFPTRGRTEAAREQIERLLLQIQGNERIVCVVDGCTEADVAMVREYEGKPLLPVLLAENVGVNRARALGNTNVTNADAIVCEIDDHDPIEPNALATIRDVMGRFDETGLIQAYCDVWLQAEAENPDGTNRTFRNLKQKADGRFATIGGLAYGMRIYRKWAYDMIGGYPQRWYPAGDYALCCMLEQLGGPDSIAHIEDPLITVDETQDGITNGNNDRQQSNVTEISNIARRKGFHLPWAAPTGQARTESRAARNGKQTHTKPRICFVCGEYGRGHGGGQLTFLSFMGELEAYDIHVLYGVKVGEGLAGVSEHAMNEGSAQTLRGIEPDIIVTDQNDLPGVADVAAALDTPVVCYLQFWRTLADTGSEQFWRALDENPDAIEWDPAGIDRLRQCAAVVPNSEFTESRITPVVDDKCTPPVTPPIVARDCVPEARDPRYVLCCSGQRGKASAEFVELARRNQDREFRLLAGDAPDQVPEDVPENLTVEREWIDDMAGAYGGAACVFIGTRTAESFGRVAAEARTAGIPIIARAVGNLRNIAPGGGVLVERDADIEDWQEALETALDMDCEPTDQYLSSDTQVLTQTLGEHRRLGEICFVDRNAPGVSQAARYYREVFGTSVETGNPSARHAGRYGVLVMPGYTPTDMPDGEAVLVAQWHSHFAQMDSSRHECSQLAEVLRWTEGAKGRYVAFTCESDAAFWQRAGYERAVYLPVVMPPVEAPDVPMLDGVHVFVPGPYGERKNIALALAVAAEVADVVHVTDWINRQAKDAALLAQCMGAELQVRSCPDEAAFLSLAARCDAALCLSFAETFCYSAAQCISAGTPVLGWAGLPACGGLESCTTDDPTDVDVCAGALRTILADGMAVAQQQTALQEIARARRDVARDALLRLSEAGHGA